VAKGTITSWSCDPSINGLSAAVNETDYILDQDGHQVTEMASDANGSMAWSHTNVWADGNLVATYSAITDSNGQADGALHFYLNDWLGTRRVQTDYAGVLEQTCSSLPYGDSLNCTQSTQFPTEHHFTGKERDSESGNDYFDARYYSSSMGRFLSPDWSTRRTPGSTLPLDPADDKWPVPYAKLDNPQSLNLYSYVLNNPLGRADADGHDFVILNDSGGAYGEGHNAALVGNDKDGWTYFSANGYGDGVSMDKFKTFSDFQKSDDSKRYDNGYRVETTPKQDAAMKDTGGKEINTPYSVTKETNANGTTKSQNCADLTADIGKSGGVKVGTPQTSVLGKIFTSPNQQYSGVEQNNKGTTVKPHCTGNNCN